MVDDRRQTIADGLLDGTWSRNSKLSQNRVNVINISFAGCPVTDNKPRQVSQQCLFQGFECLYLSWGLLLFSSKLSKWFWFIRIVWNKLRNKATSSKKQLKIGLAMNDYVTDWNVNILDAKKNFVHHPLKGFARVAETERRSLKSVTSTRRNERGDITSFFSWR